MDFYLKGLSARLREIRPIRPIRVRMSVVKIFKGKNIMSLQHINIKFFVENPEAVKVEKFRGVFNTWIQKHALDELLIDVADYLHLHHGPGMILVGHEANYSLDFTDGKLGLLYNRKAQLEGGTREKLTQAARAALTAAKLLEKEGVKLNTREAQIIVNDRLSAPNTAETFAALEADLKDFFGALYKSADFELIRNASDPRERFTVNVKTSAALSVEALLQNLSV